MGRTHIREFVDVAHARRTETHTDRAPRLDRRTDRADKRALLLEPASEETPMSARSLMICVLLLAFRDSSPASAEHPDSPTP
jgi:hypothetical protein